MAFTQKACKNGNGRIFAVETSNAFFFIIGEFFEFNSVQPMRVVVLQSLYAKKVGCPCAYSKASPNACTTHSRATHLI
jgi:hypothetical protein